MNGLEGRVANLEDLCKHMNANVYALQTLVYAVQDNDYVTAVSPIFDENEKAIQSVLPKVQLLQFIMVGTG